MPTRTIEGKVVFVPENITPQGLERIAAQIRLEKRAESPRRTSSTQRVDTNVGSRPNTEDAEVDRRVANSRRDTGVGTGMGWGERAFDSLTFGNGSRVAGGVNALTQGVVRAVSEGDVGQIGREYRIGRDVHEQQLTDYDNANPIGSVTADIGGALINPVGTGARVVAAGSRALGRVGARNAGARGLRTARRMERMGPVAQGVAAGALDGAIRGASESDSLSEIPANLARGAGIGGAAGGVLGGAVHGGRRAVQIIRDAKPENAARTAYGKVDEMLETAGTTPRRAVEGINEANAAGGDMRVMDVAPNLSVRAADISRRSNVSRSNDLISTSRNRIEDRASRFAGNVHSRADVGNADADDTIAAIRTTRKARGQVDYAEGGTMDLPIQPTPSTVAVTRQLWDNPSTSNAVKQGFRDAEADGVNLGNYDPNTFTHIPSLRVFDAIKRRMDDAIGSALRTGNKTEAMRISRQMRTLKDEIATQNDDYAEVLRGQRDLFEQEDAVRLGTEIMGKLGSDSSGMLKMVRGLNENQQLSARIGFIDKLIKLEHTADPVARILRMTRLDGQREILEWAFGGKKQVESFKAWLRAEAKAKETDRMVAPGSTSDTSRFQNAADEGDGGLADVATSGMKGQAFGGPLGGIGNIIAKLGNISHGTSKYVHNEIARILLSKGEDLEQGIKATAMYIKQRQLQNRRYAKFTGKAGQAPLTNSFVGDDNAI